MVRGCDKFNVMPVERGPGLFFLKKKEAERNILTVQKGAKSNQDLERKEKKKEGPHLDQNMHWQKCEFCLVLDNWN